MLDVLEPLARLLLQPLLLGLLVAAAGCVIAARLRRRWGWGVVAAGLLLLWLPATTLVGAALVGSLEDGYPPVPVAESSTAGAIVVLGGSARAAHPPREMPDLHEASDRLWHAARLYRAGRAPLVVASGGGEGKAAEAPVMQRILTDWGVPDSAVVEEAESTSTYENARYTARLLAERGVTEVLLVTSALHMPRAAATFRATRLAVHPAPTDIRVTAETRRSLIPDAEGLQLTSRALHEFAARTAYRWAGRLAPPAHAGAAPAARTTPARTDEATPGRRALRTFLSVLGPSTGRRTPRTKSRNGPERTRRPMRQPAGTARAWAALLALALFCPVASAQNPNAPADTPAGADSTEEAAWARDAWTPITERRGARLSYIFYREADSEHDGVVIRVDNDNDVPIVYDFTVVFRSAAGREVTDEARGSVPPKALKTGDTDGRGNLFWIPFSGTGETIDQVGVRSLKVWHVPPERLEEVKRRFGIPDDPGGSGDPGGSDGTRR